MRENDSNRELRWIRVDEHSSTLGELPIAKAPFPARPESDVSDLVNSVRIQGVLAPLLVRLKDEEYQIVCGYRRYLAAKKAGIPEIPAQVAELGDSEATRCYLSSKIHRRTITREEHSCAVEVLRIARESRVAANAADELPTPAPLRATGAAPPSSLRAPSPGPLIVKSSALGKTPSRATEGDRLAVRLLDQTSRFFHEVRDSRKISPGRLEEITGELLTLIDLPVGVDLRRLFKAAPEEVVPAHSLLVSALCAHVTRSLGWSGEETREIVRAGILHDIGMVFVRSAKLSEPRALTDAERAEVESHTRIGCALVAGTGAWSEVVALCARDHHERWDGSGYPSGRKGSEVSFPARLMGLLDTYAALLTARPHRDALPADRALERVCRALELGLFDPSFLFLLRDVLQTRAAPGLGGLPAVETIEPARNSVEMHDRLATMQSTVSEQYT